MECIELQGEVVDASLETAVKMPAQMICCCILPAARGFIKNGGKSYAGPLDAATYMGRYATVTTSLLAAY